MTPAPEQLPPAAERAGTAARGVAARVTAAWSRLETAQRLAAYGAIAMFVTMFLPWYSKTTTAIVGQGTGQKLANNSDNLSAWTAFSFVEAATLLVAASVLTLLFRRGEGRAFHLPGGDGTVIAFAGGWAAFLIFYRLLDQPDDETTGRLTTLYGLRWGIFFALGAALFLASAGVRLRAAHVKEPPLPPPGRRPPAAAADPPRSEDPTRVDVALQRTRVSTADRQRGRPGGPTIDGGTQLSFDEDE